MRAEPTELLLVPPPPLLKVATGHAHFVERRGQELLVHLHSNHVCLRGVTWSNIWTLADVAAFRNCRKKVLAFLSNVYLELEQRNGIPGIPGIPGTFPALPHDAASVLRVFHK